MDKDTYWHDGRAYSLNLLFFAKILSNQVHSHRQYGMISLGWALLDLWLLAFSDLQQISLYRNSKRPCQLWKKLVFTFLNITIDICKDKDKRIKNNLEKKKKSLMKPTSENWSMAENTTCYTHIDWLLINSTSSVVYVQSNFMWHTAVVNVKMKLFWVEKYSFARNFWYSTKVGWLSKIYRTDGPKKWKKLLDIFKIGWFCPTVWQFLHRLW